MTARVSAASDLPRAPPTEPRSMRRDITPPPSKRSTASRQHDVYRPSPYAPGEDYGRGGRLSISDVWRPGPNHYAGVTRPEQTWARSPEQVRGDRARRAWRESPPRQTFERVQEPSQPPPPPGHGRFERKEAGPEEQEQEQGRITAVVLRLMQSQQAARLSDNVGKSIVASTFAAQLTDEDIDVNSSSVSKSGLRSSGTEDRHSLATANVDGAAGEQRIPLKAVTLSLQDAKLFLTDSALLSDLQSDKTMNSPNRNMVTGTFKRTKVPTEDTASTSSTTDSKTKTICRECRTPGTLLTPLVKCIRCERGYHHSCGNPKPPKGAGADEFVCGKCLKSQGRGPTSGDVSRSASVHEKPTVAPASLINSLLQSTDDLRTPRPPTHDQDQPVPHPSTPKILSPIPATIVADISSHDSKITDPTSLPIGHHPYAGRQMAKRGGRASRLRKERTNSAENIAPPTSAQNQSDTNLLDSVERISDNSTVTDIKASIKNAQKETDPSSGLVVDTTLKNTPENRVKKCSQCGKMILGSVTQCRACSTIDAKAAQDHVSRAPGSVSDDSDVEITGMTTAAAIDSAEKPGKGLESEESSRRLVANILKRTNRDDHLFIPVKKHKPSYAADLLAEAENRLRAAAALTNIPSTYSGLHPILENRSSQTPLLVPVAEHVAASTSPDPLSLHSSRNSSSDDYRHVHQTPALKQSSELETGASLTRLEEIVKDVTSQVKQRDAQRRMFQNMPPPALGSPILGTRDDLTGPEVTNESFELDNQPVQMIKQNHLAQQGGEQNAKNIVQDQVTGSFGRAKSPTSHSADTLAQAHPAATSDKAQTTSKTLSSGCQSCRDAHRKCVHKSGNQIPLAPIRIQPAPSSAQVGMSNQSHHVGIVEKVNGRIGAKAATERLSYRCGPCINAHKKCLHEKGGALDFEKCVLFLQLNPTRPLTGKVSIEMWQEIHKTVRLFSKDSNEANVAVSETESSDLSMGLDAEPLVGQITPVERGPTLRFIVKDPPRNSLQKESTSKNALNLIETRITAGGHVATEGPAKTVHGDRPVPRLQIRAAPILGENLKQTEDDSDDDLPLAFTRSRPQDDSSDDDLPLAVTRSGDRVERYVPLLPPRPSTAISKTPSLEPPDVRNNLNVLKRPRDQLEDSAPTSTLPISGSVSTLSPSEDPGPDVVLPNVVPDKISKTLPRRRQPQSQLQRQPAKTQPLWTDEDEQRALDALRARGVVFESDSEDDGDASDYYDEFFSRTVPALITDPLHYMPVSQNPFDVDHSLDLRNLENRYKALDIRPPWNRNRPTKKEFMSGKTLLLHQTRENRLKYGDPHKQLIRKVGDEVSVTALVEIDKGLNIDPGLDTPGRREPSEQRVSTTFREFMGMPKRAVITQGKNKDELVFLEKKLEGGDGAVSRTRVRARRVRDEEAFPFVYN